MKRRGKKGELRKVEVELGQYCAGYIGSAVQRIRFVCLEVMSCFINVPDVCYMLFFRSPN